MLIDQVAHWGHNPAGGGALRSSVGFGSPPQNPTSRFSKWGRKTDGAHTPHFSLWGAALRSCSGGQQQSLLLAGSQPGAPAHPPALPRRHAGYVLVKVTAQELRAEFFHLDYKDGLAPAYTAYVRVGAHLGNDGGNSGA